MLAPCAAWTCSVSSAVISDAMHLMLSRNGGTRQLILSRGRPKADFILSRIYGVLKGVGNPRIEHDPNSSLQKLIKSFFSSKSWFVSCLAKMQIAHTKFWWWWWSLPSERRMSSGRLASTVCPHVGGKADQCSATSAADFSNLSINTTDGTTLSLFSRNLSLWLIGYVKIETESVVSSTVSCVYRRYMRTDCGSVKMGML